jgi:Permuted papain-like amidase enzyme, YaeF/YiiX, C92 family
MRGRAQLLEVFARFLAEPVARHSASIGADAPSLGALLRRGDVLLTQGITRMAMLVRYLTGSPWSHVSMYVGALEEKPDPCCVVEADVAAGVRAVPLSEFKGLRVRVLRPTGLQEADRQRLADWVVSRIGDEYDIAHAWALGTGLLRMRSGRRVSLRAPQDSARRYICSSLLAHAFGCVGSAIVPLGAHYAGETNFRCVTPRDFERAPIFEVVNRDR